MKFFKKINKGQKGFTLIDSQLLIVIAILGILAAVIIPNVAGFVLSGNIGAANSEAAAVKTAVQGFLADNPTATGTIEDVTSTSVAGKGYSDFLPSGGAPKAVYTYTISTGNITAVVDGAGTTWPTTMQFSGAAQTWGKHAILSPATNIVDII